MTLRWGNTVTRYCASIEGTRKGSKVRLALILKAMLNINDIILTTENVEFSIFFFFYSLKDLHELTY